VSGEGRVELELAAPRGPIGVAWELHALRALGEGADEGAPWTIEGDPAGASLVRVLSAALEDGTVLGLAAVKADSTDGHGDEEIAAFISREGGDPQPILDARLSTEYDSGGAVRRAGLELWIEESGPPARGAGDRESATEVSHGGLRGEAARMEFRLDGVPGVIVYELLRPAG
jgi:hypothetical protein